MKNLILIIFTLLATACTKETEYGDCVGVIKSSEDPKLIYEMSYKNVIIGIVLSETLVIPTIVVFADLYCPTGKKK